MIAGGHPGVKIDIRSRIHHFTCFEPQDIRYHFYDDSSSFIKPCMVVRQRISGKTFWRHEHFGNPDNLCRRQLWGLINQLLHRERDQRLSWFEVQHFIYILGGDVKENISWRRHHCPLRRLIVGTTLVDEVTEDIHWWQIVDRYIGLPYPK